MFSKTPSGAEASAIIYSIVETAKANNLDVYEYLMSALEKLPNVETTDDLASLLPLANVH